MSECQPTRAPGLACSRFVSLLFHVPILKAKQNLCELPNARKSDDRKQVPTRSRRMTNLPENLDKRPCRGTNVVAGRTLPDDH